MLLDHLRSNEFFHACTVFLNPRVAEAARRAPEWFRGARVCYLDGETLRWLGGLPPYRYGSTAWARLRLIEVLGAQEVREFLLEWPEEDVIEVRACQCDDSIAAHRVRPTAR